MSCTQCGNVNLRNVLFWLLWRYRKITKTRIWSLKEKSIFLCILSLSFFSLPIIIVYIHALWIYYLAFTLCSFYFKIKKGLFSTLCFFLYSCKLTILPISNKVLLSFFNTNVLKQMFKGVPWNNFCKVSSISLENTCTGVSVYEFFFPFSKIRHMQLSNTV